MFEDETHMLKKETDMFITLKSGGKHTELKT